MAGRLASEINAEKLILLTDVEGVRDADGGLLSTLTVKESETLINDKVAEGGMVPKLNCAIEAVKGGVHTAHIIDGRVEHSLLLEVFTDEGIGTLIQKS